MQIRLILLDFDGTLASTEEANMQAYLKALREEGITLNIEEYRSHYFGMRCPEFLRTIGITNEVDIDRIRRRKIELYPTFFDTVRLNEPLWNFVQDFRAQGGKAWIVSTGQIENLSNVMHYLGIEGMVDGVISSRDVSEPKPSPEAFLKAMEYEGVTPAETLIFEDSPVGVAAAEASGANYIKLELKIKN
ncbi:MAG: HAD family phosphatase [Alistipes sp.]|nr:HAD family phosphatase [Alistipes sp.]